MVYAALNYVPTLNREKLITLTSQGLDLSLLLPVIGLIFTVGNAKRGHAGTRLNRVSPLPAERDGGFLVES